MRATFAKSLAVALTLLIVGLVVLWFSLTSLPRPRELPDKSLLSIDWVSYGRTNIFVDGTLMDKVLGGFMQRLGLKGPWKPPTQTVFSNPEEVLVLRLRLQNVDPRSSPFFLAPHQRPQLFISDPDTGHRYMGHVSDFRKSRDGWNSYVSMGAFPRRGKHLPIEIRDEHGKTSCKFSVKNPDRRRDGPPSPAPSPATVRVGEMDLTFGRVAFPEKPRSGSFAGMPMATLNLNISRHGTALTNWRAADMIFRDPYGNHRRMNAPKSLHDDWQRYGLWGFLDPTHAWKLQFSVTLDAGFTADELCTFEVNYPLAAKKIETCHGRTLQVGFVNRDMLAVNLVDTNANVRLTFVEARDQHGVNLYSGGASWSQHQFWRGLEYQRLVDGVTFIESLKTGAVIRVTVAVHTNYPAEYVFAPPRPRRSAHGAR
jgi:hypothetical protein